ncbi:hypothetical protein [Petroclostridium sp. X23]|uniref:hypothetical protein n=1 Tax=Petroclostridium sp. X23 TaxID=3045146 RepID=UPI0024AD29A5|nr:hypothetical protein [Petroclostridium sp. X23]WHH61027.1 hypothetical protein QKW49_10100 [Petroclostridium sp. X23]
MHTHTFEGATSLDDRHRHRYLDVTYAGSDMPGHTHIMHSFTTYDDGHIHHFYFTTGPSIEAPGGHYHNFHSVTQYADGSVSLGKFLMTLGQFSVTRVITFLYFIGLVPIFFWLFFSRLGIFFDILYTSH